MLALILLGVSFSSGTEAQQFRKPPRIGFLATGSASAEAPRVNAFREGLQQLGYTEAQNIQIEYRMATVDQTDSALWQRIWFA